MPAMVEVITGLLHLYVGAKDRAWFCVLALESRLTRVLLATYSSDATVPALATLAIYSVLYCRILSSLALASRVELAS